MSCEKVYEQDDLGPDQNVRKSLSAVLMASANLAQFLSEHEDIIHSSPPAETVSFLFRLIYYLIYWAHK